jgi:hypothetical protein
MNTTDIYERLTRLERRSRFQQATIAVLTLGIATLIWMAATPPLHVLRASGLTIIDPATGKVVVKLKPFHHYGFLTVQGPGPTDFLNIQPYGIDSVNSSAEGGFILDGRGVSFEFGGALAALRVLGLDAPFLRLMRFGKHGSSAIMQVGGGAAPSLSLDSGGFAMDIGGPQKPLPPGKVQDTTVDSIIMLNKEQHTLIWKAP